MKTLASILGGAISVTEAGGAVYLNWDESLGSGKAAGILKGKGSLILDGHLGLQLAEAEVNKIIPAVAVPFVEAGEGILNAAVEAVE